MSNGWQAKQVALLVVGLVLLLPTYGMSVVLIMLAFHQANTSSGPPTQRLASPFVAVQMQHTGAQPTLTAAPFLLEQVSPSRQRGYDRLLGIFSAHHVLGMPPEQAARQLAAFFRPMPVERIESLLHHPQVMALLQPARSADVFAPPSSASPSGDWWKKPDPSSAPALTTAAPAMTSPADRPPSDVESAAFWATSTSNDANVPSSDDLLPDASASDTCGAATCNRMVTDFDYRCFSCRLRFCMTHKGSGVDCPLCAST